MEYLLDRIGNKNDFSETKTISFVVWNICWDQLIVAQKKKKLIWLTVAHREIFM